MPWLQVLISIVVFIGLLFVVMALLGKLEIRGGRGKSSGDGGSTKSDAYQRGADSDAGEEAGRG